MTIAGISVPVGWGCSPISLIVPVTGACRPVEMKPAGLAITSPRLTFCPTLTTGKDGAPRCWERGSTYSPTKGMRSTGRWWVSCLFSSGWIPCRNVGSPMERRSDFMVFLQTSWNWNRSSLRDTEGDWQVGLLVLVYALGRRFGAFLRG